MRPGSWMDTRLEVKGTPISPRGKPCRRAARIARWSSRSPANKFGPVLLRRSNCPVAVRGGPRTPPSAFGSLMGAVDNLWTGTGETGTMACARVRPSCTHRNWLFSRSATNRGLPRSRKSFAAATATPSSRPGARPGCSRRRGCPSPRSGATRASRRSWTGASRRSIRRSTAGCSAGATSPSTWPRPRPTGSRSSTWWSSTSTPSSRRWPGRTSRSRRRSRTSTSAARPCCAAPRKTARASRSCATPPTTGRSWRPWRSRPAQGPLRRCAAASPSRSSSGPPPTTRRSPPTSRLPASPTSTRWRDSPGPSRCPGARRSRSATGRIPTRRPPSTGPSTSISASSRERS